MTKIDPTIIQNCLLLSFEKLPFVYTFQLEYKFMQNID